MPEPRTMGITEAGRKIHRGSLSRKNYDFICKIEPADLTVEIRGPSLSYHLNFISLN